MIKSRISPSISEPSASFFEKLDLVGIGFGPSNLALAIALREIEEHGIKGNYLFLEAQKEFGWHPNLLFDYSRLQVSFLKDLVTQRNPMSPFSFVNYLLSNGRLHDFINGKTLHPLRKDFFHYLKWAAQAFYGQVTYGAQVTEVSYCKESGRFKVNWQRDDSSPLHGATARSLVVSTGGIPAIPLSSVSDLPPEQMFHTKEFLSRIAPFAENAHLPYKFCVVGAGQSAAEVVYFLLLHFPQAQVTCVSRELAFKHADSTPFINEVFNPEQRAAFYYSSPTAKAVQLEAARATNYSVVDQALIENIFQQLYLERVQGRPRRLFMNNFVNVCDWSPNGEEVTLTLRSLCDDTVSQESYSAVVFATGYRWPSLPSVLEPLRPLIVFDDQGVPVKNFDYSLKLKEPLIGKIFVPGYCEHSHGISDTLLSNMALRAGEIAHAITQDRKAQKQVTNGTATGVLSASLRSPNLSENSVKL